MRTVVDASVLVGELLRRRGRALLSDARLALFVAQDALEETEHELPRRLTKLRERVPPEVYEEYERAATEALLTCVSVVPQAIYVAHRPEAEGRVPRDPQDWPTVAASLLLDAAILTHDDDFLGCGRATWTVETLASCLVRRAAAQSQEVLTGFAWEHWMAEAVDIGAWVEESSLAAADEAAPISEVSKPGSDDLTMLRVALTDAAEPYSKAASALARAASDLGYALGQRGEWPAAEEAHELALTLHVEPFTSRSAFYLAIQAFRRHEWSRAEELFRKPLTLCEAHMEKPGVAKWAAQLQEALGLSILYQGREAESEPLLRAAYEGGYVGGAPLLAFRCIQQGDKATAEAMLRAALDHPLARDRARLGLAALHEERGELETARTLAEAIAEPGVGGAWGPAASLLVLIALQEKRYSEAEKWVRKLEAAEGADYKEMAATTRQWLETELARPSAPEGDDGPDGLDRESHGDR